MEQEVNFKQKALDSLRDKYKDREDKTLLHFENPFECLVAVILSAQCTDQRVNMVTEELFKEHNTPEKMLELSFDELKEYINSCGLANNKAKNILAASQKLVDEFNSEVPKSKKEIMTLPGVGSKTANVVLANAYGIPGLGVDTHVKRVSNRIGLASAKTPDKIEAELCELIPEENWNKAHHWLIWHGRETCSSRKPKCEQCQISEFCQFYLDNVRDMS